MFDFSSFAQGFALGLGMFVCPGPKDLVILQQALRRRSRLELLAVGVGSDALLIALGISGVSAGLQQAPQAQQWALWIGVGLMLWHGVHAAWHVTVNSVDTTLDTDVRSDRAALWMVSFLNPVAWMDTVLVIGTAGAMLPSLSQPLYGLGATTASTMWFLLLTLGAGRAASWMARANIRRGLDGLAALTMIGMAVYIAQGML